MFYGARCATNSVKVVKKSNAEQKETTKLNAQKGYKK